MNLGRILDNARRKLEKHAVADPSIEAEVLVRHVLGLTRAELHAGRDRDVSPDEEARISDTIKRRISGEPAAYITGRREFYGRDFSVNPAVLIPRPETELLVERAIAVCREYEYSAATDIGTGCGNIAVSLALELPVLSVQAIDISPEALETARRNAKKHGVSNRVDFRSGNLLEPLTQPVDIICANLPYVADKEYRESPQLSREPCVALAGGPDGLDCIREFCRRAPSKLNPGGAVLLEVGLGQAEAVKDMLLGRFPGAVVTLHQDLAGIDRLVEMRLTVKTA